MVDEPDLRQLVLDSKGDRSFERFSRDCGGQPTSKRLQQIATGDVKAFPDVQTITGLARGVPASTTAVVLAAARSLGLRVSGTAEDPDALVVGDAASLTPDQRSAIRAVARTFAAGNRRARVQAALATIKEDVDRAGREIRGASTFDELQPLSMRAAIIVLQRDENTLMHAISGIAADDAVTDFAIEAEELLRQIQDRLTSLREISTKSTAAIPDVEMPVAAMENPPAPPGTSEEPDT